MRISIEDSTDLGIVMYSLTFGAINTDDVANWASRAIDQEGSPPQFLYTMLDLKDSFGKSLREEIGFQPGPGLEGEDEFDYIRQIAVRRGLKPFSYLGQAALVTIPKDRERYINDLFLRNFSIDVDKLPTLEDVRHKATD